LITYTFINLKEVIMKRHGILSVLSAVMFILVFSISASAVEGILVGLELDGLVGQAHGRHILRVHEQAGRVGYALDLAG